MSADPKSSYRIGYYDFLRGIAILMVIGIHTYIGHPLDSFLGNTKLIVRQLLNTAVPLFLAISAFFLCKKPLDTWPERFAFWKKQIPRVYIPCLIWSIPYLLLAISDGTNPVKAAVLFLIGGFSIYYFIALIIQYYLLLPWLQPFGKKLLIGSAVISSIAILIITYIRSVKGINLPLITYSGGFPVWMVFFVWGGVIRYNSTSYKLWVPILVIVAGLVLSYFESRYLISLHNIGFGIKLSSFIYSAGVIMLLLDRRIEKTYNGSKLFCRAMEYIGRISFGMYLTHILVKSVCDRLFSIDSWAVYWLVISILTIVLIAVGRKILPKKVLRIVGFER